MGDWVTPGAISSTLLRMRVKFSTRSHLNPLARSNRRRVQNQFDPPVPHGADVGGPGIITAGVGDRYVENLVGTAAVEVGKVDAGPVAEQP
jgi:hypothetical protein